MWFNPKGHIMPMDHGMRSGRGFLCSWWVGEKFREGMEMGREKVGERTVIRDLGK